MNTFEEALERHRASTFRTDEDLRLSSVEEAVSFVEQREFIYFWPIKGIILPSLWAAVAGNRLVGSSHDDPGHVTWGWKDGMLDKRRWYYAKVLRGKATIISLEAAPCFYALSENFGDPEEDYLQSYADGEMTRESKQVFEAILHSGPIDTVALRRAAHLASKQSKSAFERALATLQKEFRILPVGVGAGGAWKYSFVYDAVHRHYPEIPLKARDIGLGEARRRLLGSYFASVGAASEREAIKLFQWNKVATARALERLVEEGTLVRGTDLGLDSRQYVLATLAASF